MGNLKRSIVILFILFIFGSLSALGQPQAEGEIQTKIGWSSVDNVFIKQEEDIMVKKPMTGPIRIGFTTKEVQEVMGVPDRIDEEGYIFYYRQSPIYFNDAWMVQSWDNRYGNLDVLEETVKITPGSHISEIFKEKGFPLRITKIDYSYHLEYPDEIIYVGETWNVEAIQQKHVVEYNQERPTMDFEEFLEEFNIYLSER